jgi:hypothetical protein
MRDERKFRFAVFSAALLCVLAIAYNIVSEYFLPDIEGYMKRRLYYERVISKKGLSMHRAMYWREADGPEEKTRPPYEPWSAEE